MQHGAGALARDSSESEVAEESYDCRADCERAGRYEAKVSSSHGRCFQSSALVIDDPSAFRTKEQVLFDLSKAMGFSPMSLEANRLGRLSGDQFKQFIGRCLNPAGIAVLSAIAPFLLWIALTGMREHVSF